MVETWKHHRPLVAKPGDLGYPEGYHEVLVACRAKRIPGFATKVDIREWLDLQSKNFDSVGRMHNG